MSKDDPQVLNWIEFRSISEPTYNDNLCGSETHCVVLCVQSIGALSCWKFKLATVISSAYWTQSEILQKLQDG